MGGAKSGGRNPGRGRGRGGGVAGGPECAEEQGVGRGGEAGASLERREMLRSGKGLRWGH